MRIAIIGEPGAGKTTLARVLAHRLGVTCIDTVDTLRQERPADALLLDGVPATPAETVEVESILGEAHLDHVLHLHAAFNTRVDRIARRVNAGSNAAEERNRLLASPVAQSVAERLASNVPVTVIDANRSRGEVLGAALDALGLPRT